MSIAYIAMGANLGDRQATLRQACVQLKAFGEVTAVSSVYETEPFGYADQPRYLNAVVRLDTKRQPDILLHDLLGIEQELGRVRTFPNAPRTLDLDLLFYDDRVIDTPDLVVPHPRLHERGFVLVPLNDIAPEFVHPQFNVSVETLLNRLGPISDVYSTADSLTDVDASIQP